MNDILLDTSAYIALTKEHPRTNEIVAQARNVYVSAIVLGELLAGFRKSTRPDQNKTILETFIEQERVEILPIDDVTANHYSFIQDYLRRQGTPLSQNDLWVAACAMQHALHLITLDRDFLKVPQILVECFNPV